MKQTHPTPSSSLAQAGYSGSNPALGESEEGRRPTGDSPSAGLVREVPITEVPATEVMETIPRRRFSAQYKLRILLEADACGHGQLGALLRREGLYYSHIKDWRVQRDAGALEGLSRKRGPKKITANPLAAENARLEKLNRRLEDELRKARIIIEYQKKMAELLGEPIHGATS